ncbi:olfactory receptor 51E1-like [Gastrophryne carolinensis]
MASDNSTCSMVSFFLLSGIPGLEDYNLWFGSLLALMYIVAVLGNTTVLYIIKVNQDLHKQMFIFLFVLAAVELLIASITMPRMLGIFWFESRRISFNLCLTQMFFLHFLSALESGVLLAMAVDRYLAICHPLHYPSILSCETIRKILLFITLRAAAFMIPLPLLIKRLPLWKSNVLIQSYCLQQDAMRLACSDIKVNIIYGLLAILAIMGVDVIFISISYLLIVKTVVSLVREASLKFISTCVAHICAVLIYYIPLIGLSVVHRFGNHSSLTLYILFGNIYLLLPAVINPLIYVIKAQQIRSGLRKLFCKGVGQSPMVSPP